jgi:NitT/TauT family transport system ATP-binding protein
MTPRPGRLMDDVVIDLPRPRGLEVMTTPAFGAYVNRIRACFEAKGGLDL